MRKVFLKISKILFLLVVMLFAWSFTKFEVAQDKVSVLYNKLDSKTEKPNYEVFSKAVQGYMKLNRKDLLGNRNLLTIIDFGISSNKKRLWVIDLDNQKIIYHTLVAHGRNSGEEYAKQFSNLPESYKSSLGFYVTGKTYYGKHGLSLYLDGVENGFNDKARERTIVMHGADYVSNDFIKKNGRLGRSLGCPALSMEEHQEVINLVANKTCLFIYSPNTEYLSQSKVINEGI